MVLKFLKNNPVIDFAKKHCFNSAFTLIPILILMYSCYSYMYIPTLEQSKSTVKKSLNHIEQIVKDNIEKNPEAIIDIIQKLNSDEISFFKITSANINKTLGTKVEPKLFITDNLILSHYWGSESQKTFKYKDYIVEIQYNQNLIKKYQDIANNSILFVCIVSLILLTAIQIIKTAFRESLSCVSVYADKVTKNHDYSVRMDDLSPSHPCSELFKSFNNIIIHIQAHDLALREQYISWERAALKAKNEFIKANLAKERLEEESRLRTLVEKQIQIVQNHLNSIINSMPSGIIGVNNSQKITEWNLTISKLTGIKTSYALGKTIKKVYPKLLELFPNLEESLMKKDSTKLGRVPIHDKKTDVTTVLDCIIYPIGKEGEHGTVIRLDDMTMQSRIEDIMVQTEKMMSVGGLAAGMAHEINNPLGGILQGAQNIIRRLDPNNKKNQEVAKECNTDLAQINEYLEKRNIKQFINGIRELGTRSSTIVKNMLQFSRSSSPNFVSTDIKKLIDRAVDLAASDYNLKRKYDFKKIILNISCPEPAPMIECLPQELEQVLINLIRNAAQAMSSYHDSPEKCKIDISIELYEGKKIHIKVSDNGPGISEKNKKRVFEPFFTTKDIGVGTGLGLSVSFFIIDTKHRGQMFVESEIDQGASFNIILPIEQTAKQAT